MGRSPETNHHHAFPTCPYCVVISHSPSLVPKSTPIFPAKFAVLFNLLPHKPLVNRSYWTDGARNLKVKTKEIKITVVRFFTSWHFFPGNTYAQRSWPLLSSPLLFSYFFCVTNFLYSVLGISLNTYRKLLLFNTREIIPGFSIIIDIYC